MMSRLMYTVLVVMYNLVAMPISWSQLTVSTLLWIWSVVSTTRSSSSSILGGSIMILCAIILFELLRMGGVYPLPISLFFKIGFYLSLPIDSQTIACRRVEILVALCVLSTLPLLRNKNKKNYDDVSDVALNILYMVYVFGASAVSFALVRRQTVVATSSVASRLLLWGMLHAATVFICYQVFRFSFSSYDVRPMFTLHGDVLNDSETVQMYDVKPLKMCTCHFVGLLTVYIGHVLLVKGRRKGSSPKLRGFLYQWLPVLLPFWNTHWLIMVRQGYAGIVAGTMPLVLYAAKRHTKEDDDEEDDNDDGNVQHVWHTTSVVYVYSCVSLPLSLLLHMNHYTEEQIKHLFVGILGMYMVTWFTVRFCGLVGFGGWAAVYVLLVCVTTIALFGCAYLHWSYVMGASFGPMLYLVMNDSYSQKGNVDDDHSLINYYPHTCSSQHSP
eukprot:PhF_6_TR5644/c0_g1_i2/m.8235